VFFTANCTAASAELCTRYQWGHGFTQACAGNRQQSCTFASVEGRTACCYELEWKVQHR